MPNFADYIFNRALNLGLASVYVGIINNGTSTAYKAGPTGSDGLFTFTAVPAGLYTVYTSPTGSGLPPGGDWVATGETSYVVNPASPVANTDLAGPLVNAVTAGSNLSVGAAPGGVGSQSVALINNPTLSGLLTLQAGLTLTGLLTLLDAASRIVPGGTSLSLRNHANNADNVLVTDAGVMTIRAGLNIPDISLLFRKLQLENNVTRAYSQQAPGVAALTGAWANYGTALTITPAVNSLVMCWASSTGLQGSGVVTDLYLRLLFSGGNGLSGGGGVKVRVGTGVNPGAIATLQVFDVTTVLAGAVTLQPQMQIGNAGNFTTDGQGLTIFALAIPST